MTRSLNQLQKEIARLQSQVEAIKKKEVKDVISRIKEAIAAYDLTATDLGLSGSKTRKVRATAAGKSKARKSAGRKSASRVKYRDGAGNTWTGHGRRPQWFLDAVAAGQTPEQLAA